jgi:hypothetical protein
MSLLAPISWGDLIDRISILTIKVEKVSDAAKRENSAKELAALAAVRDRHMTVLPETLDGLRADLEAVNRRLWDIEDRIREHERAKRFDADFIALARAVYHENDTRGALKRRIDVACGSEIIGEKEYAAYDRLPAADLKAASASK